MPPAAVARRATLPEFHAGRPPRNKGMRYPAEPPDDRGDRHGMRRAGNRVHGHRLRGLIVVLWRAGLRIHEALALAEAHLDPRRGSLLVPRGKGGRRREAGMDDWAREQLAPLAPGAGKAAGGTAVLHRRRPDARAAVVCWRGPLGAANRRPRGRRATAVRAAPARHAHAVEMAREGVPLIVIQRQLGHTNLEPSVALRELQLRILNQALGPVGRLREAAFPRKPD